MSYEYFLLELLRGLRHASRPSKYQKEGRCLTVLTTSQDLLARKDVVACRLVRVAASSEEIGRAVIA